MIKWCSCKYLSSVHSYADLSIQSNDNRLVALPDIVLCDPSPWDFDKANMLGISRDQVSYISHLLYPQSAGINLSLSSSSPIYELDKEYQVLLKRYNNNPRQLLNSITKDCSQLVQFCQLGTNVTYFGTDCCPVLFSNVEYTLQYKCFSSGGQNNFPMWEASQAYGITVSLIVSSNSSQLNGKISGRWAVIQSGVAAAVTDKKSTMFYVAQTDLKLLEPNTFNVLSVEKKVTDSTDKNSFFQPYEVIKHFMYQSLTLCSLQIPVDF